MSFAEGKATPIAQSDVGLDRTKINSQDQIQLIADSQANPNVPPGTEGTGFVEFHHGEAVPVQDNHNHDDGGKSKAKRLSMKVKNVLHIGDKSDSKPEATAPILADAPDTASKSRLIHDVPEKKPHTLKDFVHDPVDTVKSKVTGTGGHQVAANIAAQEVSHGREVELVRAHDRVARAKTERERVLAIKELDEMMKARQDMFVRWTMDRHVTKVRILPKHTTRLKERREFLVRRLDGTVKMDWEGYITHVSLM